MLARTTNSIGSTVWVRPLPACTDPALPVATAVARVSMLGYLGSVTGPALIGLLAGMVGLAAALLLPALAVAAIALAARAVRPSGAVSLGEARHPG